MDPADGVGLSDEPSKWVVPYYGYLLSDQAVAVWERKTRMLELQIKADVQGREVDRELARKVLGSVYDEMASVILDGVEVNERLAGDVEVARRLLLVVSGFCVVVVVSSAVLFAGIR
jgi:hypothetical protein